ncbi:PTS sugar transporter subunit IIA [Phytoactinopolyspora limicola]|uniref:PTS sugar transporter subunit IIA n=1 Tax=Phytoactinopolyspora limicola TaxID=2715536 RepID=UPI0014073606|nr:PTS glucose transporter subunit IIA [Phytoactinopolyspora limicola]
MSRTVAAPVSGRIISLADVPDAVFAEGLVGPGIAIDPGGTGPVTAVAPIDGSVVKLHPHAYIVQAAAGMAVLVHLGIDTVELAGQGFETLVPEKATVVVGQPLVTWNPVQVAGGGRAAVCPVVALEAPAAAISPLVKPGDVIAAGEPLFVWDSTAAQV